MAQCHDIAYSLAPRHGLQLWLVMTCWAQAPGVVALMECAQEITAEEDFPDVGPKLAQGDYFLAESPADEPLATLPKETSVWGNAPLDPGFGIDPVR